MDIQAVVFDYGKVICFPPEPVVMEQLARLVGIPVETMDGLVWKCRDEYDRGTIDGETYYRNICAAAGRRPEEGVIEKLLQIDLDSWKRLNPETVRLMEDVKAAGLQLGILSNMPHDFLAWSRTHVPLFSLPDVGIFSCESASIKPEEKIYRDLFAALGRKPGEIIFFDDAPQNIEKAAALGIRAFLWKDAENARTELRRAALPL